MKIKKGILKNGYLLINIEVYNGVNIQCTIHKKFVI